MRCPKCHNENEFDSLTCDYCMAELPMTEQRKQDILLKQKQRQKTKRQASLVKLMGMLIALAIIIGLIIIIYLVRK